MRIHRSSAALAAIVMALGISGCASAGDQQPADPVEDSAPASPTPSETAEPTETPSASAQPPADGIEPLDDDVLGTQSLGAGASWIEPGETLAVFIAGSGTADCVGAPVAASAPDFATIEIELEEVEPVTACTMDLRLYGWSVPIADDVDATQDVTVLIGQDDPDEVVVAPDDVIDV